MKKPYGSQDGNSSKKTSNTKKSPLGARRDTTSTVAWAQVNPELITFLVQAVTLAGGAIMLGRSSDGGVLTVRIYHDDYDRVAVYIRPTQQEGIDDLVFLANEFAGLAGIEKW